MGSEKSKASCFRLASVRKTGICPALKFKRSMRSKQSYILLYTVYNHVSISSSKLACTASPKTKKCSVILIIILRVVIL